jgi:hypothetical protein
MPIDALGLEVGLAAEFVAGGGKRDQSVQWTIQLHQLPVPWHGDEHRQVDLVDSLMIASADWHRQSGQRR